MQAPSGPQFATVPSRSFPIHFPERWVPVARGSVSRKEHPQSESSLWCCRRDQSPLTPWPRSKHPAQGVLFLMGWGESPAGRGGLSCTPQCPPSPPSPCLCTAQNTQLGPARPSLFRLPGSGRPCFAVAGVLQSPPLTVVTLRSALCVLGTSPSHHLLLHTGKLGWIQRVRVPEPAWGSPWGPAQGSREPGVSLLLWPRPQAFGFQNGA